MDNDNSKRLDWVNKWEKLGMFNSPKAEEKCYQDRVYEWIIACFPMDVVTDVTERNFRFLEEALELTQSLGATKEQALKLVEYVFSRPKGDLTQEVGGVMVTLASLCNASSIDLDACAEEELERVWKKIDKIRAKHFSKPRDIVSPLPGTSKD